MLCQAGQGLLDLSLCWPNTSKTHWEICNKIAVVMPQKTSKNHHNTWVKAWETYSTLPLLNSLQSCCTFWKSEVCAEDDVFYPMYFKTTKWNKNEDHRAALFSYIIRKEMGIITLTVVFVYTGFSWKNHESLFLWFWRESIFRSSLFHLLPQHHYVIYENWRNISYKKQDNETILPAWVQSCPAQECLVSKVY